MPRHGTRASCLVNPKLAEVRHHLDAEDFVWIDFEDPGDDEISRLGELLGLHQLTVEDAQTFNQRPRFEEFPGYAFMVLAGVDPGVRSGSPLLREIHLIVSGTYIVTLHKRPLDALTEVRRRNDDEELSSEQLLIYRILDAIASTYFPVLSRIDDDIDEIEDDVVTAPDQRSLQRIFGLKRDLTAMRRVVTPMRDLFARSAERINELPGVEHADRVYFRDLYDTMIRISDLVDSYRDLLSGATDLYLSTIANRQAEINKQLTIIATIFLPLMFLTGFFGQNFALLVRAIRPTWTFYAFGLGLLAASCMVFVWWFRHKRWI